MILLSWLLRKLESLERSLNLVRLGARRFQVSDQSFLLGLARPLERLFEARAEGLFAGDDLTQGTIHFAYRDVVRRS